MLRTWFEMLREPLNFDLYSENIVITNSPVFAFYVKAAGSKDIVAPLYKNFCFFFHRAIEKFLKRQNIAQTTNDDYIRACRVFFEFADNSVENKKLEILIPKALKNYVESNKTNDLTKRAKRYEQMLVRMLMSETIITPHPHSSRGNSTGGLERTSGKLTDTPDKPGRVAPGYIDTEQDELELWYFSEGLADDDIGEQVVSTFVYDDSYQSEVEVVPAPPRIRLRLYDTLSLRSNLFFFDSRYPSLHHLTFLFIVINDTWKVSAIREKTIMALLLLLMMTGTSPENALLMGTYVAGQGNKPKFDKHKLLLSRSGGRFYLIREKMVSYKKIPVGSENCRTPLELIWIRLPEFMSPYLEEIWAGRTETGHFFSMRPPYSNLPFKLNAVKDFLQEKVNAKYGLSLTPHKITSAFFPLFCSRYGLDEIAACYISGRDLRLFKSQLHYIHVDSCQLCRQYLKVAETVMAKLMMNAAMARKEISEVSMNEGHMSTDEDNGQRISDDINALPQGGAGHGSGIIPDLEKLKLFISALQNKIITLSDREIILRHNLYTIHAYLCGQFNFALRPRNDLPFLHKTFGRFDYELINDKTSCRYYEDRLFPVSDCLKTQCQNLRSGFPRFKRHVGGMINSSLLGEDPEKFFIFLTKRGKIMDFTLVKARRILKEAGLPFPFNMKSPRHFVRTYIYEKGICNEFGDAWLGHSHISREPLAFASSLILQDMKHRSLGFINQMLADIGFAPVSYLPEGMDG